MVAGFKKLPLPKVVAVDVDGTLLVAGKLNQSLVDWCRDKKAQGFQLMLWSMRGADYAGAFVERFQLDGLFDWVVGKPGVLVDDQGWQWADQAIVIKTQDELGKVS